MTWCLRLSLAIEIAPGERLAALAVRLRGQELGTIDKYIFQGTTQAVIASEAKQSPSRKEEIASSQETLLAMTRAEQLRPNSRIDKRIRFDTVLAIQVCPYCIKPKAFLYKGVAGERPARHTRPLIRGLLFDPVLLRMLVAGAGGRPRA